MLSGGLSCCLSLTETAKQNYVNTQAASEF